MDTIRQYIDHHSGTHGKDVYLIAPDISLEFTYSELQRRVDEIGQALDGLGVNKGAKIAFLANNGAWTTLLYLGVMANGRVIVPLNAVAGSVQLEHVLNHSDSEVVFVSTEYKDKLMPLLDRIHRDIKVMELNEQRGLKWTHQISGETANEIRPEAHDPALLLYTSGSTGPPKGAVLTHSAIVSGGHNVVGGHELTEKDRALCVLPIYHINGAMVTVAAPLISGGSVVMPNRFSAKSFWSLVAKYQCTWSSVVPTIIKYLLDRSDQEPFDFGNDDRLHRFRFGRSASAPLPSAVLRQWEETFKVPMIETLGLTETAGTVATNPLPPRVHKPGSVGMAYGNEIKVIDETGADCATRTVGEIVIRGDNLLDHYYKNQEATDAAFADDWFRTGDMGFMDEDGYLFITGRLKELIIRGGENIAPREIDDVLYKHDAILEAATVGVDDEQYGQEVVACVVRREGFYCSEQEIKEFCQAAVGEYKSPKRIYFMDDLPKGPSGKILRLKLPDLISHSE
ncbi:MAG: AMP-binding protein [Arenicellales bacterium]|nr:AMP-binding protein [Arenicellales bacterium]